MTVTLNSRADFTLDTARRVAWGGEGVVLGVPRPQVIEVVFHDKIRKLAQGR